MQKLNDHNLETAGPVRATIVRKRAVTAPGEIRADAVYTLSEFSARCGLGRWGIKELRAAGLKVFRFHGRTFVAGKSFLEFLQERG